MTEYLVGFASGYVVFSYWSKVCLILVWSSFKIGQTLQPLQYGAFSDYDF